MIRTVVFISFFIFYLHGILFLLFAQAFYCRCCLCCYILYHIFNIIQVLKYKKYHFFYIFNILSQNKYHFLKMDEPVPVFFRLSLLAGRIQADNALSMVTAIAAGIGDKDAAKDLRKQRGTLTVNSQASPEKIHYS